MWWDDTDCCDRGMQLAISKGSCDAMRPDEMRKGSTFERPGIRLASHELVAAKRRRLACHLWAQSTSDCFEPWAYHTLDKHVKVALDPSIEGGGLDPFEAYPIQSADKRRSVRMKDG